jgi:hypothetical protein
MEAVIKVSPSKFDDRLLEKIKNFIGGQKNMDVTISLKELDPVYIDALDHSIEEAEAGQSLVSFTMEDFMAYTPDSKQ